ncbi:DUF3179 domain-containing protein [Thiohalomonas denitrificans]|uniref:DUF3179 domain-containing protein n=1 Tax=Thiohalomonas denitrificans TaxID=415747 RepID=UPI001586CE1C|nr:DUF3179 domain-containing protein [Thiohalomonas denitrificans]
MSPGSEGTLPVRPLAVPLAVPLETYQSSVVSGGPGRDGVPSIDEPRFLSGEDADRFLASDDIVFGVTLEGESRAYPRGILVWHEIVNDRIGDQTISITYCPLTGTVLGFERGSTTLGVSGQLVNSNLILYDRATKSLWPQILSTAISGPLKGKSLKSFPVVWTTWSQWQSLHPDTTVLSTNTGYTRNYFHDPYGGYHPKRGYYDTEAPPRFPVLHSDSILPPKEVVIGARTSSGAVAFHKESLGREKIMEGRLAAEPVIAVYDDRLGTAYIYQGPAASKATYRDGNLVFEGETYAPDALPLERLNAFEVMWFAWYGFFPETVLHR